MEEASLEMRSTPVGEDGARMEMRCVPLLSAPTALRVLSHLPHARVAWLKKQTEVERGEVEEVGPTDMWVPFVLFG